MNEKNCIVCKCHYNYDKECRKSTKIADYCKHLGCCKKKCYDKLSHRNKTDLKLSAFLRHYWNSKNSENY